MKIKILSAISFIIVFSTFFWICGNGVDQAEVNILVLGIMGLAWGLLYEPWIITIKRKRGDAIVISRRIQVGNKYQG